MVAGPLQGVLDKIVGIVPDLLKAAAILFVYWAVAAKEPVLSVCSVYKVRRPFWQHLNSTDAAKPSTLIGRLLFYVILLFGIPPFLAALGQEALVAPLQTMLSKLLSFLLISLPLRLSSSSVA